MADEAEEDVLDIPEDEDDDLDIRLLDLDDDLGE
jgi:hypothetical protein